MIGLPAPTADEVRKARSEVQLRTENRCTAARDLLEGTPEAGTVILSCEKKMHPETIAHRMSNPDGSTTTWRY